MTSTKEKKQILHFKRLLVEHFSSRQAHPRTEEELLSLFTLPAPHKKFFSRALKDLASSGELVLIGEKYLLAKDKERLIIGLIRMHPRGFGFVQPPSGTSYTQDIFIPKHLTQNSVDGDIVEILVEEYWSDKGPEGKVLSIVERGRQHLAGTIYSKSQNQCLAYAPLLGKNKRVIVKKADELVVGDRLILRVIDWGSEESFATAEPSHKIGHINDPTCDIPASIEEFELRTAFQADAIAEAKAYGDSVKPSDCKGRKDLKDLETFTIDPDTARDFDDALSIQKKKNGEYTLWVHVADVSHYVRPGTALDREAALRCNSTYFPGFCLPMLPHELSSHLCSLMEDVQRLACTIEMHFDSEGLLKKADAYRSVIKSDKRFTYKQAKRVLDGDLNSPHKESIELMRQLCFLLKKQRAARGSVEFGMSEVVMIVDEKGVPTGFERVDYDITHQLVEEFMLKANEVVATRLTELGIPLAYRVHEEPSPESLKEFALLARAYGFNIPDTPLPQDIQKLFDEAAKTPFAAQLAVSFIRSMRLAFYSPEQIGHYGLNLEYYTHFTSPIRRYIDLVVHRLLMEKEAPANLEETAHRCSEQERISSRAESSVVLLKKYRYLKKLQEEDPSRDFEAIVSRVKPMGIIFDIPELMLDSFIHISELDGDYYIFDETRQKLVGRHSGHTYAAGTRFRARLVEVDFITLESAWELASQKRGSKKKKRKR